MKKAIIAVMAALFLLLATGFVPVVHGEPDELFFYEDGTETIGDGTFQYEWTYPIEEGSQYRFLLDASTIQPFSVVLTGIAYEVAIVIDYDTDADSYILTGDGLFTVEWTNQDETWKATDSGSISVWFILQNSSDPDVIYAFKQFLYLIHFTEEIDRLQVVEMTFLEYAQERGIKTLVLTNLVSFGQSTFTGFSCNAASSGQRDGYFYCIGNGLQNYLFPNKTFTILSGHSYYTSVRVSQNFSVTNGSFKIQHGGTVAASKSNSTFVLDQWYTLSGISTGNTNNLNFVVDFLNAATQSGKELRIDDVISFDLFEKNYTKVQIDAALLEYGYLPYNEQKTLIDVSDVGFQDVYEDFFGPRYDVTDFQGFADHTVTRNVRYGSLEIVDLTDPSFLGSVLKVVKTIRTTLDVETLTEEIVLSDVFDLDESITFELVEDGYTGNEGTVGRYELIYEATDPSGNTSQHTMVVWNIQELYKAYAFDDETIYVSALSPIQSEDLQYYLKDFGIIDPAKEFVISDMITDDYAGNEEIPGTYTLTFEVTYFDESQALVDLQIVVVEDDLTLMIQLPEVDQFGLEAVFGVGLVLVVVVSVLKIRKKLQIRRKKVRS